MKVAFFTNTILEHGGGLEKYFIETTAALASCYPDLEISIVTFDEKHTELLQHMLSVYYVKEMPIKNIYREKTEDILKKLGRIQYIKCASFSEVKAALLQADVIYAKNEIIDLSILKFFGYRRLPPIIAGVHTPIYYPIAVSFHSKLHNFLYGGSLYAFLMKGLASIHVTNASNEALIKKIGFSGSVEKILNPFPYQETAIVYNETGEFRVLSIGRISREKGIDLLVECIEKLSFTDIFPRFRFKIAGSGESRLIEKLKILSSQYANVEYVGHVPNAHINMMYAWADVVIIPSHFETANYVALEAGANGKIAIASDIPGPQDIIEHGKTGYLLPLRSEAFVEKILELHRLKQEERENFFNIGRQAKMHIKAVFDSNTLYSRFYVMLVAHARVKKKSE